MVGLIKLCETEALFRFRKVKRLRFKIFRATKTKIYKVHKLYVGSPASLGLEDCLRFWRGP